MPNISDYPAATTVTDDDVFLGNDGSTTKTFTATVLREYMAIGLVLIWDDVSDYIPADLKDSSYPKEFRGPTDPDTVAGVVLNPYDAWVNTA